MWNRIRKWWQAEGALAGLQGVSDRMLADMGLERETLAAQIRGHAPLDAAPTPLRPMGWPGRCQAASGQACLPGLRE